MDHLQYLMVLGACLLVTLPLEVVLGARVYRQPRRLAVAVLPAAALFYLWDAVAVSRGHWTFSASYVTGVTLPLGVPLEELAFFVVVPICSLLSFEAVRNLLDADRRTAVPVLALVRRRGSLRAAGSRPVAGDR